MLRHPVVVSGGHIPAAAVSWEHKFISKPPFPTSKLQQQFGKTAFSRTHKQRSSSFVGLGKSKTSCNTIKAAALYTADTEAATKVKVVVTVQVTVGGVLSNIGFNRGLDDFADLFGKSLLLELVPAHLDPETGATKATMEGFAHKGKDKEEKNEVRYESDFVIPSSFGEVGAILVQNEHHKEMFVKTIELEGFPNGTIHFICESWVHSKFDNKQRRIFFTSKSYLPSQTPDGLTRLREKALSILRGNGQGERKRFERIYDYDVYNDLGNPNDENSDSARPVLGGEEHPYPRRCRTGRPPTKKDPFSEERSGDVYVPRDEAFSEVKNATFSVSTFGSVLKAVLPSLKTAMVDPDLGFPYFTAIDSLFNEGIDLPDLKNKGIFNFFLPRLVKAISDTRRDVLLFETPMIFDRDKFSWFKDGEFGRQTLAGLNPCCIKLVTEWPLKSNLDQEVYGTAESAITQELIEKAMRGYMTFDQALKQKKLFVLDYHDVLLPYVHKVRSLKGKTLYGSRTLFFLTPGETLRPIAIELTRPKSSDKKQWREVFSPLWDATSGWLWKLAKVHVLAHDSGFHQLVSHWLRTHCCTEPYIIAANRQLSAMHPIYRLLLPHFRYTMEINALAREALINANGIIESSFSPGKYAIELSSAAYDQLWRFDLEALPADLINRGMAVEDPTAPHGLKLTIEDYPYANDGLLIWDTIKQWVTDYVSHYYPESSLVESDEELQAWWTEVRTLGHADKKDEPWWPVLKTPKDLIGVLTTIIWVTSGHHAAVNFGQYDFAGYMPNRPTIARTNIPKEDPTDEEWKKFIERPEETLLACFPSQIQATSVMSVLDVLSTHSPEEEYLGETAEVAWAHDPVIYAAFERYNGRLREIEGIIDARNVDVNLKNRTGAGVTPYQLLKPFSEPGATGKGIPNSVSI